MKKIFLIFLAFQFVFVGTAQSGMYSNEDQSESLVIQKNDQDFYFYYYCKNNNQDCENLGRESGYKQDEIYKLSTGLEDQATNIYIVNMATQAIYYSVLFSAAGRALKLVRIGARGGRIGAVALELAATTPSFKWRITTFAMLLVTFFALDEGISQGYEKIEQNTTSTAFGDFLQEAKLKLNPDLYNRLSNVFGGNAYLGDYTSTSVEGLTIEKLAQEIKYQLWTLDNCITPLSSACRENVKGPNH